MKALLAVALLASGCAFELASSVGASVNDRAQAAWTGEIDGSLVLPIDPKGLTIGGQISGRGRSEDGPDWSASLRAGYLQAPDPEPCSLGWQIMGSFGAELDGASLSFRSRTFGAVDAGLVIYLSKANDAEILNSSFLFVRRAFELVPFIRYQLEHERRAEGSIWSHAVGVGVGFRLRLESNLL